MRADYLDQMRAPVDCEGQLNHRNGHDLLCEVERLRPLLERARNIIEDELSGLFDSFRAGPQTNEEVIEACREDPFYAAIADEMDIWKALVDEIDAALGKPAPAAGLGTRTDIREAAPMDGPSVSSVVAGNAGSVNASDLT